MTFERDNVVVPVKRSTIILGFPDMLLLDKKTTMSSPAAWYEAKSIIVHVQKFTAHLSALPYLCYVSLGCDSKGSGSSLTF